MNARHLPDLWRHFGPRWLGFRAAYAAQIRSGTIRRRLPARDWDTLPLTAFLQDKLLDHPRRYLEYRKHGAPGFFFTPDDRPVYQSLFSAWDDRVVVTPMVLARQIAEGRLRYFEHTIAETGFPPDWHANPFTGERAPAGLHWSRIGDFSCGDIKIIWEPSRFAFAYALARAYWRSGDESHAERFWCAAEDWQLKNPPQLGPNWKCGQETAFRVMAWCFALYAFLDAAPTTAARVKRLAQAIAVSAERISGNIEYALNQRNNHGISEALGLYTVGALFPEFSAASTWRRTGREALESTARELIYDDGSFVQHSVNYHRVMLHDFLWAIRLGDLLREPFSDHLKHRVGAAADFLYQIQDDTTGRVPNYGANDGALVLPLSNCDYRDYRPAVQAVNYLLNGTRRYPTGAWDEDLLWLFGPASLAAPIASPARRDLRGDLRSQLRTDLRAEQGGYYTLRSPAGFAFVRAASFRHRPSQADMLHVDLWWRGQNIATDAGTFSYNAPPLSDSAPFAADELARTAYHNTVGVDGLDQMERAGKFLWLPWLHGKRNCVRHSPGGNLVYWEGEHDGYRRLKSPARHRRGILRAGDHCWVVIDQLSAPSPHEYRLQWLLADLPFEWDDANRRLTLHTTAGGYAVQVIDLAGPPGSRCTIARADTGSARGWRSAYYFDREPALSLDLRSHAEAARFITVFAPAGSRVDCGPNALEVEMTEHRAVIEVAGAAQWLIGSAELLSTRPDGVSIDRLEPTLENPLEN